MLFPLMGRSLALPSWAGVLLAIVTTSLALLAPPAYAQPRAGAPQPTVQELSRLRQSIDALRHSTQHTPGKDLWVKINAVSGILAGVTVALVGFYATSVYNKRQQAHEDAARERDRRHESATRKRELQQDTAAKERELHVHEVGIAAAGTRSVVETTGTAGVVGSVHACPPLPALDHAAAGVGSPGAKGGARPRMASTCLRAQTGRQAGVLSHTPKKDICVLRENAWRQGIATSGGGMRGHLWFPLLGSPR